MDSPPSISSTNQNAGQNFTCLACRVVFHQAELQRAHYRTDWHRYNLKRKVANMPAVTAEEFQVRVIAARDRAQNELQEQNSVYACNSCRKYFSNQLTLENHLKSKKHREHLTKFKSKLTNEIKTQDNLTKESAIDSEEKSDDEEVEEVEEVEEFHLTINDCLFCPHESVDLQSSLRHMTKSHSFFIPNVQYITNLEDFIEYLCQKISIGLECIYCNDSGKAFHTIEAVKNHMLDKGHCKFPEDEESMLEYSDFYDFSSSYPDDLQGDKDEELDSLAKDIRLSDDGMTLILPNGNRAGHRSLRIYYKQQYPNYLYTTPDTRRAIKVDLTSQYKGIGWNTTTPVSKSFIKRYYKVREIGQKVKSKNATKLSIKANKFQPHFRCQVDF